MNIDYKATYVNTECKAADMNIECKAATADSAVAVVNLSERLAVFNNNIELFEEALVNLYKQGHRKVILDFSNVNMIDSRGLSALLVQQKKFKDYGGELVIRNLRDKTIKETFRLMNMRNVIAIIDSDTV